MESVAKSYMRKCILIYEKMRKYLVIHIWGGPYTALSQILKRIPDNGAECRWDEVV